MAYLYLGASFFLSSFIFIEVSETVEFVAIYVIAYNEACGVRYGGNMLIFVASAGVWCAVVNVNFALIALDGESVNR